MADEAIHYGPIYGRGAGASLALCLPKIEERGSNTMSHSLHLVGCRTCQRLLEQHLRTNPPGSPAGERR